MGPGYHWRAPRRRHPDPPGRHRDGVQRHRPRPPHAEPGRSVREHRRLHPRGEARRPSPRRRRHNTSGTSSRAWTATRAAAPSPPATSAAAVRTTSSARAPTLRCPSFPRAAAGRATSSATSRTALSGTPSVPTPSARPQRSPAARDARAMWRLYPLWRDLVEAVPHVALDAPRSRFRQVLGSPNTIPSGCTVRSSGSPTRCSFCRTT
ncbi:DUF6545 domain-containing protein [Streptomyces sp. NPDC047869]|uniref:DUF6545 domain-containing protein n=1 Tax=Streptomyces sp. NPDC047869 TaxID=3154709 RepID=UPI003456290A